MASPLLFGSAIRQAARQLTRVAGPKLVEARRTVILGERILHVNGTYGSSFRLMFYPFTEGNIDPERPQHHLMGRRPKFRPVSTAQTRSKTLPERALGVFRTGRGASIEQVPEDS